MEMPPEIAPLESTPSDEIVLDGISEEALLSTTLETENGAEIVADCVRDSLVKECWEEEQEIPARTETMYRRAAQLALQSLGDPEQQGVWCRG